MNKGKQLSINLISQIATFVLNLCISFFLTPYIVEHIGKDVYGFVSLSNNFVNYVTVFTIALNGMLNRYIAVEYNREDYTSTGKYLSSAIIANMAIMLVLLPVIVLVVGNLERLINVPAGFEFDIKLLFLLTFLAFAINLPGSCFNVATYTTNRLDKNNICNMLTAVVRIAVILASLLIFDPHVWYVGLGALISTIYSIVVNIRFKRKLLPQVQISFKAFDWAVVKEIISTGMWNSINQMTQMLLSGLDLLITNLFVSVASMSLLSYAKMLPSQLLALIATISGLFAPTMTIAYAQNKKENFVKETHFALKLCGFLCCVPIIGLVIFGENFFGLWLRTLQPDEVHMVAILAILSILPNVFSVYIYPLYSVSTITRKLKVPVLVSAVMGVLNIIIVFILLQTTNLGVYAVAGVSSILFIFRIVLFVPTYAAYCIGEKYTTFYKPLIRGVICNVLLLSVFSLIHASFRIRNWSTFIAVCALAAVCGYIIAFYVLFDKEDRRKVFAKLKRG